MSKTNHRRRFKDYRFNLGQRTYKFVTWSGYAKTLDGSSVSVGSTLASENSRSVARDRKGAKKFVHSRRRRVDRDFLKKGDFLNA